jgi:hypothetical protein
MAKLSATVPGAKSPTRTSAHTQSIGAARDDVLRVLVGGLGKKAVAAVFQKDVRTIERWLKSTSSLSMENERLLRDTYQIYAMLVEADDAYVARAWFIGMNPALADRSPIDMLAEGRAREVVAAARVFVSGA